jgi:two-component system sensor histidine kinase KdpD
VPAILTTVLSVLAFDYLFIPPLYRLLGFAPEYALTFFGLLGVSIIISTLVSRERALTRSTQRRAEQVTRLYELSRDLASAVDLPGILDTIIQHVSHTFDREAVILLADKKQLVLSASSSGRSLDTSELTAAEWAFQQGRPAGASTGTFSYAAFRYFPLQTGQGTVGVLGVKFQNPDVDLHPEQMRLLGAFVTKAAVSIERGLFAEEASQAEILRATEKLQSALLNSISHDLRTPLASITGVLSSLRLEDDFIEPDTRRELVETAYDEAERLNRLVGNLLDMSRLEAGTLKTLMQPCDIQDVVGSALNTLASRLEDHPVDVQIPPDLPLVPLDFVLIAQVLINLLENAVKYSPEGGQVAVSAQAIDREAVQVTVSDHGPGIPEEDLERVFEKFYRVKRFENVVGTGLGLSICKGVVEAHGGTIRAENQPGGGVSFRFTLPLAPNSVDYREPVVTPISGDNGYNE